MWCHDVFSCVKMMILRLVSNSILVSHSAVVYVVKRNKKESLNHLFLNNIVTKYKSLSMSW